MKRRNFIRVSAFAGAATAMLPNLALSNKSPHNFKTHGNAGKPMIISTWDFGMRVPETALRVLKEGGSPLDAVEEAIKVVEADPTVTSVGCGGFPDRDGRLTLDACVMDSGSNAGSVVFLEHIMHPISVARMVMEKTQHVVLAGEGALNFAVENGMPREDLLTDQAKEAYKNWLQETGHKQQIDKDNHDTIGLIVMDGKGDLAGGCSTSGAAWKMHGRVGDSPLIGAGLYVDNEIGAATATGMGETVIKVAGSFLVVELMRNGKTPQEACELAMRRLVDKNPRYRSDKGFLAGFIALNKSGDVGACSYGKGLQYTLNKDGESKVYDGDFINK